LNSCIGNRYRVIGNIGSGSHSVVYECADSVTNTNVAVKRVAYLTSAVAQRIRTEVELTNKVRHPHIIRITDVVDDGEALYLVMEKLHQSLWDFLSEFVMDAREVHTMFFKLVSALKALHDSGICHRDIKLENVMLDVEHNPKIIDFGFASSSTTSRSLCGSPLYMPPEVAEGKQYDGRLADVWSLGVVLYCMIFNVMPPDVKCSDVEDALKVHSKDSMHLAHCMLETDPAIRYRVEDILKHPYTSEFGAPRSVHSNVPHARANSHAISDFALRSGNVRSSMAPSLMMRAASLLSLSMVSNIAKWFIPFVSTSAVPDLMRTMSTEVA